MLSSGDLVHRIVGSLSGRNIHVLFFESSLYLLYSGLHILFAGTLGFVMSEVEDGKPFSQVVRSAKNLGYTEPGLVNCSPASVYLINRFLVFLVVQVQLGKK